MAMNQPPDAVQAKIAPYTGRTSLFLFGGFSLIALNLALSRNGWEALRAIFPRLPSGAAPAASVSLLDLVAQLAILGALLLIGGVSDEAGTLALVFLAALWLLFLYSHRGLFSSLAGGAAGTSVNLSGGGGRSQ